MNNLKLVCNFYALHPPGPDMQICHLGDQCANSKKGVEITKNMSDISI